MKTRICKMQLFDLTSLMSLPRCSHHTYCKGGVGWGVGVWGGWVVGWGWGWGGGLLRVLTDSIHLYKWKWQRNSRNERTHRYSSALFVFMQVIFFLLICYYIAPLVLTSNGSWRQGIKGKCPAQFMLQCYGIFHTTVMEYSIQPGWV